MAFSRLTYPGDGSTVSFTINFPLGFLSRSDVVAYVRGELDGLGGQIYRTITWINDGLITISGAAPTVGQTLVIDRTVSKTSLKHSYANGVPIEASNLDESNKQAIMAVHEVLDGRFSGSQGGDFNLGTNRVINMGNAVDPQDAVTFSQLQDYTGNAPAYAQAASNSASAASASATAAGSAKTAAESARDAAQAAAAGMKWRPEVVVATTANITLSGTQTIDGVAVIAGDLVLVKNQTTTANNGVYVVAAGAWTRATDADTWSELVSQVRVVSRGSTSADLIFICTSDAGGTLGTTAVTWAAIQLVIADGSITYVKMNSAAIASSADIVAQTANKLVPAANLKPALKTMLGLSAYAESAPTTITLGGLHTFTHGLSTPVFVQAHLKCISADVGYAVGEEVHLQLITDTGTLSQVYGGTVGYDATTAFAKISASGIAMLNKSSGAYGTIDSTKWQLILKVFG